MYAHPNIVTSPVAEEIDFAHMHLKVFSVNVGVGCLCFRTVLFDDDIYLKGRGYGATMEARKWLETSEDFTQVRKFESSS